MSFLITFTTCFNRWGAIVKQTYSHIRLCCSIHWNQGSGQWYVLMRLQCLHFACMEFVVLLAELSAVGARVQPPFTCMLYWPLLDICMLFCGLVRGVKGYGATPPDCLCIHTNICRTPQCLLISKLLACLCHRQLCDLRQPVVKVSHRFHVLFCHVAC